MSINHECSLINLYSKTSATSYSFNVDTICENACNEIFIYSVLLGRPEMAKIFWNDGVKIFLILDSLFLPFKTFLFCFRTK